MKRFIITTLAAFAILGMSPMAAQAAPWVGVNQRQSNLDDRIDDGVRSGELTRAEASRLRTEFRGIARLEAQYRRGGLTNAERRDLDRRFEQLSNKVRRQKHDRQDRR